MKNFYQWLNEQDESPEDARRNFTGNKTPDQTNRLRQHDLQQQFQKDHDSISAHRQKAGAPASPSSSLQYAIHTDPVNGKRWLDRNKLHPGEFKLRQVSHGQFDVIAQNGTTFRINHDGLILDMPDDEITGLNPKQDR